MAIQLPLISTYTPDCVWGFLNPAAQLVELPTEFSRLTEITQNLGNLLREKQLRPIINDFPVLELPSNLSQSQYERLWVLYGMVSSAYLFSIYEDELRVLPQCLALPFFQLSQRLSMPPILNYHAYVYNNFQLLPDHTDKSKPESYAPLFTFSSPTDAAYEGEKWFIVVHVAAEKVITHAVAQLVDAQHAVLTGDNATILACFKSIIAGMKTMAETIARMSERLEPDLYAFTTRKYVFPFDNVVFEGVNELGGVPQKLRGETGGQSPVPRAIGAFLGIEHGSVDMSELGLHMHPSHQVFIAHLKSGPSIKDYLKSQPELVEPYNETLRAVADFRKAHMNLARTYLTKHTIVSGTGKSTFTSYLGGNLVETLATTYKP